jgi:hypothetical protein
MESIVLSGRPVYKERERIQKEEITQESWVQIPNGDWLEEAMNPVQSPKITKKKKITKSNRLPISDLTNALVTCRKSSVSDISGLPCMEIRRIFVNALKTTFASRELEFDSTQETYVLTCFFTEGRGTTQHRISLRWSKTNNPLTEEMQDLITQQVLDYILTFYPNCNPKAYNVEFKQKD